MLKERVNDTIVALMKKEEHPLLANVYNHKVIFPREKDSIFISFRIYNQHKVYFIISLLIQLKETYPAIIFTISRLSKKRYFFKHHQSIIKEIPHEETIPFILTDQHLMTYLKNHKHLPAGLLMDQYDKIKDEALILVQQLEEVTPDDY